jgi:hypothetical protein
MAGVLEPARRAHHDAAGRTGAPGAQRRAELRIADMGEPLERGPVRKPCQSGCSWPLLAEALSYTRLRLLERRAPVIRDLALRPDLYGPSHRARTGARSRTAPAGPGRTPGSPRACRDTPRGESTQFSGGPQEGRVQEHAVDRSATRRQISFRFEQVHRRLGVRLVSVDYLWISQPHSNAWVHRRWPTRAQQRSNATDPPIPNNRFPSVSADGLIASRYAAVAGSAATGWLTRFVKS